MLKTTPPHHTEHGAVELVLSRSLPPYAQCPWYKKELYTLTEDKCKPQVGHKPLTYKGVLPARYARTMVT